MNRRSFFKIVTGFLAGIFLPKAKAKDWDVEVAPYDGRGNSDNVEIVFDDGLGNASKAKAEDKLMCGGQNGTLCPRCRYNNVKVPEHYQWHCKHRNLQVELVTHD